MRKIRIGMLPSRLSGVGRVCGSMDQGDVMACDYHNVMGLLDEDSDHRFLQHEEDDAFQ